MASLLLGGGRTTKDSEIDLTVGLHIYKRLSDLVKSQDVVAVFYANDEQKLKEAEKRFLRAYTFSKDPVQKNEVVYRSLF